MLQLLQGGKNVLCCAGAIIYDTGAAAPVILPVGFIEQELFTGLIGHDANAVVEARIIAAADNKNIFFIIFLLFMYREVFASPYTHFYIPEKNYIRLIS